MDSQSQRFVSRITRNTLALILAGGRGSRLKQMTMWRAKPAVPFGGKFRIIDFPLSNCINSGIRQVGILSQYKAHSLIKHIQQGWGFLRGEFGEFVELLPAQQRIETSWYEGTADAIYQNLDIIRQHDPEYVLILAGDHIYKMDYGTMIAAHVESGADMTVGCLEVDLEMAKAFGVMSVDENNMITQFAEKPGNPDPIPGNPNKALASMGIYVFQTGLLKQVLNEDRQDPGSSHDFGKDILPKLIRHQRVNAYHFVDENRKKTYYWRDVGTVDAYWEANMDLVEVDPVFNLYDRTWPIHTYIKPAPPAKFVFAELVCETKEGRAGLSMDSLITHGDIIAGGQVINSVLSPNVRVDEHARVVQSILFEGVTVGAGSHLFRTIVDKKVNIPPNTRIGFDRAEDEKRFPVSSEGVVVVARGTEF